MKKLILLFLTCLSNFVIAQNHNDLILNELVKAGIHSQNTQNISINNFHTDAVSGITHVYFKQVIDNLEIMNSQSSIHIDKNRKVVKRNIYFNEGIKQVNKRKIDANQAFTISVKESGIKNHVVNKSSFLSNDGFKFSDKNVSSEEVKGKPIYFVKNNELLAAWQVSVLNDETGDWYNLIINADDGSVIEKYNQTVHCKAEHMTASKINKPFVFEFEAQESLGKSGNNGTYRVFPAPLESPARGDRQLMNNVHNTDASQFGWHDTDGKEGADYTITRGNNVWAKEDTLGNNGVSKPGYSPDGGKDLIFDYPYNIDANPRSNLNASITNLFYWNNILHDVFYKYGFDEVSGNFQNTNYTGFGKGNDFVNADAQDGSGTDNANFATPNDGSNPRMQMYLWGGVASSPTNIIQVNSPSAIARKYNGVLATFSNKLNLLPLTAQLVLVNDGSSNANLGCSTLVNESALNGNIAIVRRGTCTFSQKIQNAQNAGAIAVIVVNNGTSAPFAMAGTNVGINIPSLMISKADGDLFINTLGGQNVSISLFDSNENASSVRTYDSDFDNGVITHEYGHGISNRLTGGADNSTCLTNEEQAGEGWSDFFGLVLTSKPYETTIKGRGIGTHLIGQDTNDVGIRPYRYSRDLTINPVTYDNIKTLSIPHGVGFVFCSVLYDIYLDMIDKYGFDEDFYNGKGGNNKAIQLVIEGLKLQPCNPGFLDSRDAIIEADKVINNGANSELIWKAFARRGMGYDASQGQSSSRSDGKNGFQLPPAVVVGIDKEFIDKNTFNVYPNPFNTELNFKFVAHKNANAYIVIFDVAGKQIFESKTQVVDGSNQIKLSNLNIKKGFYLVNLVVEQKTYSYKLICE